MTGAPRSGSSTMSAPGSHWTSSDSDSLTSPATPPTASLTRRTSSGSSSRANSAPWFRAPTTWDFGRHRAARTRSRADAELHACRVLLFNGNVIIERVADLGPDRSALNARDHSRGRNRRVYVRRLACAERLIAPVGRPTYFAWSGVSPRMRRREASRAGKPRLRKCPRASISSSRRQRGRRRGRA